MNKTMLGLKLPTDPRWVNLTEKSIEEVLTDHAYCEQKATSTCIALIQAYPDKQYLVEQLTPVVNEEWVHFRMVLKELEKRSLKLGFQRKDEYVNQLQQFVTKGGKFEDRFLDRLLMAALIEARSCERFRLLSEGISDMELREFYRKLMVAEAHHYTMFIDIAKTYIDTEKVKARWQEWLHREAEIMQSLELRGDRVH
ncbi:MAG: tRNA-(ms[2]io[6]A)-hydroxylase [Chitinophagales bacterium]|nr:tRNA-(ms[2]io[6]A)-hydroxylase [Chitinophagales bacterium]